MSFPPRGRWLLPVVLTIACVAARGEAVVVSPHADQTIHANDGVVHVVVANVEEDAAALQPVLDGRPVGEPVRGFAFDLKDVPRGEHALAVRLVDRTGRTIGTTPAVRFYVWQASRLLPARPQ